VETWLLPNRRALVLALLLPAGLVLSGIALAAFLGFSWPWRAVGWLLMLVGTPVVLVLAGQLLRPRIAYRHGRLLLYLRAGKPIAVPIEVVEGFLLGQSDAHLPGRGGGDAESLNLVLRIAERAEAWQRCNAHPALGSWCDGYVTVRGTWCEALDVERVTRLNRRLAEAQREHASQCASSPAANGKERDLARLE